MGFAFVFVAGFAELVADGADDALSAGGGGGGGALADAAALAGALALLAALDDDAVSAPLALKQ